MRAGQEHMCMAMVALPEVVQKPLMEMTTPPPIPNADPTRKTTSGQRAREEILQKRGRAGEGRWAGLPWSGPGPMAPTASQEAVLIPSSQPNKTLEFMCGNLFVQTKPGAKYHSKLLWSG